MHYTRLAVWSVTSGRNSAAHNSIHRDEHDAHYKRSDRKKTSSMHHHPQGFELDHKVFELELEEGMPTCRSHIRPQPSTHRGKRASRFTFFIFFIWVFSPDHEKSQMHQPMREPTSCNWSLVKEQSHDRRPLLALQRNSSVATDTVVVKTICISRLLNPHSAILSGVTYKAHSQDILSVPLQRMQ
jgi:hypothetical protein